MNRVTIAVLLDPNLGDGLREFAKEGPVWITGSAVNEAAVWSDWKTASEDSHVVTLWSAPRTGATENEWLGILESLELHHGELSGPGIAGIQVVCAPLTPEAQAALREFGYDVTESGPDGFSAEKSADG